MTRIPDCSWQLRELPGAWHCATGQPYKARLRKWCEIRNEVEAWELTYRASLEVGQLKYNNPCGGVDLPGRQREDKGVKSDSPDKNESGSLLGKTSSFWCFLETWEVPTRNWSCGRSLGATYPAPVDHPW